MVELRKYIFRYRLGASIYAKMIGDHEWSEYVYIGDSPEVEVYVEERLKEELK